MEPPSAKVVFHLNLDAYAQTRQLMKETGAQSAGDFLLEAINAELEGMGHRPFPLSSYTPRDPVLDVQIDATGLRNPAYKIEIDFHGASGKRIHDLSVENNGMTNWIGRVLNHYAFFIQAGGEARKRGLSAPLFRGSPAYRH